MKKKRNRCMTPPLAAATWPVKLEPCQDIGRTTSDDARLRGGA
jgi:hypothetical protein